MSNSPDLFPVCLPLTAYHSPPHPVPMFWGSLVCNFPTQKAQIANTDPTLPGAIGNIIRIQPGLWIWIKCHRKRTSASACGQAQGGWSLGPSVLSICPCSGIWGVCELLCFSAKPTGFRIFNEQIWRGYLHSNETLRQLAFIILQFSASWHWLKYDQLPQAPAIMASWQSWLWPQIVSQNRFFLL